MAALILWLAIVVTLTVLTAVFMLGKRHRIHFR